MLYSREVGTSALWRMHLFWGILSMLNTAEAEVFCDLIGEFLLFIVKKLEKIDVSSMIVAGR